MPNARFDKRYIYQINLKSRKFFLPDRPETFYTICVNELDNNHLYGRLISEYLTELFFNDNGLYEAQIERMPVRTWEHVINATFNTPSPINIVNMDYNSGVYFYNKLTKPKE